MLTPGLYLVTPDQADGDALFAAVAALLPARPALVQYRNKLADAAARRDQATRLGLTVVEGDVLIDEIAKFKEAGACGTAAVISPIGGIQYNGKLHVFHSETEVGPITQKLYKELTGVQAGDVEAPDIRVVDHHRVDQNTGVMFEFVRTANGMFLKIALAGISGYGILGNKTGNQRFIFWWSVAD